MTELYNDSSWKTALQLVQDKYGKKMTYRSIKLYDGSAASFYSDGDDLIIPLKYKNQELGDIIVDRGSLLEIQQKSEVVDLVKFLIEPKIYNFHLKYSEELLAHKSLHIKEENFKVVDLFNVTNHKVQTLSQIIHLKSHTEMTRLKVANKIHEMTERNLFVFIDDIAASISSVEDLKTLSDLTIFVPDVELLSPSMTILLQKYLEVADSNGPLFLIGSSLPLDSIEQKEWPASLKRDLMGFYFDIDRVPLSQQTSPEILELLFFQVDIDMT